jgi:hypothetical protein
MDRLPAQGILHRWPQCPPTLGPFLLTKFSIVVNIDQSRIGVSGNTGSIVVRNRQLPATERSVMLPPNTGEASCHLSNATHCTAARRSGFFRAPNVASLCGWFVSSLLNPVMKSAFSSARNARRPEVFQLRSSCPEPAFATVGSRLWLSVKAFIARHFGQSVA